MNRGTGLPIHPSLPQAPHFPVNSAQASNMHYQQQPAMTYAQPQPGPSNPYQYYVSSHYAQAYMPSAPPMLQGNMSQGAYYNPAAGPSNPQNFPSRPSNSWAQPGSVRCKKQGCTFTGSHKSVEVHMMDRHLIYPPGWENRKRKPEWDADPSLKGKPIPIQGTNVKLDTPEEIERWIAERKKRFPTAERVEEKQKTMDEAISRGQLPFADARFPNKKRRLEERNDSRQADAGWRGRGRGRGRGRTNPGGERHLRVPPNPTTQVPEERPHLPQRPVQATQADTPTTESPTKSNADDDHISDSDSDGAPEVLSTKRPVLEEDFTTTPLPAVEAPTADRGHIRKPLPKQPRRPPHNPFASRPALLRNLLLPEIRMTVSNLSQAIRFIVDNDFLANVELRPGQAQEKMIEVISSTDAVADACTSTTSVLDERR